MSSLATAILTTVAGFFKALIDWLPAVVGFAFGRRSMKANDTKEKLKRSESRNEIEDGVDGMSDDELDRWL